MSDSVTNVLTAALHGLATQQRVISDNIANIQTPGFRAGRVDFETSLRDAVDRGSAPDGSVLLTQSSDPARSDGNNVNLDTETMDMVQNGLQYQLVIQALNAKYQLLRTAMSGS